MSSSPLIHVQGVSKCYSVFAKPRDRLKQMIFPRLRKLLPGGKERKFYEEFWALRDVSLEVHRGEMVGIIGRNGSGKSTLLQIICGTMEASTGTVQTQGRIAALLELGAGFNPEFTGRENVYMNASILGLSEAEIAERFDSIVEFSEIGEFIDRPVKTYSSGMFMRLAFSVAVSIEPEVVVVDEALSVGDVGFSMKCMQRIEEMLTNGVTFLLVTHDLNMVRTMCSRALFLRDGREIFDGDAATAVEMYLMEMRAEQSLSLKQKVAYKAPLNSASIAFGTQQGAIISVTAWADGEEQHWFKYGQSMVFEVTARLGDDLLAPAVAISLHDARGYLVAGMDSRCMQEALIRNADGRVRCRFLCELNLLPGTYAVSARIFDYPLGAGNVLIEKQVNALSIEIVDDGSLPAGQYGVVDMGGRCEQVS